MDPDIFDSIDTGDDLADAGESAPPPEPITTEAPADPAPETAPPQEPAPERVTRTIAPQPAGMPIQDPSQRTPPAAEAQPQEGARVPLASLLEERAQWKRENEALQARLAALEAKTAAPAPAAAPAEPPAPAPEWVEDPKAYVDAKVDQAIAQLEQTKNLTAQQQAELENLRLASAVQKAEAEIATRLPDFSDALNHLRGIRYQELKLAFPDATDDQVAGQIIAEERQVAQMQIAKGRNPYDYAYQLARLRGYTPPANTAPPGAPPAPPAAPNPPTSGGGPRTLDPSVNLNQVNGAPSDDEGEDSDDDGELLKAAQAERFGRRRA